MEGKGIGKSSPPTAANVDSLKATASQLNAKQGER